MTAEEFLKYIGEVDYLRVQGKRRLSIARGRYDAYCRAYNVKSFTEARSVDLHFNRGCEWAIRQGLLDRDAGKPMVEVPEFMEAS